MAGPLEHVAAAPRREDVATMRFSEIYDDQLHVNCFHAGEPTVALLPVTGLHLGTVVDRCRLVSRSDYLVSTGIRKNSPDGCIHPDGLTKECADTRKLSGLSLSVNLPALHEIRSLSGRLYEAAYGKKYSQKLFGHRSDKMTELYLNNRQNKYVMI